MRFKFLNGGIRVLQSRSTNSIVVCWFVLKIRGFLSLYPFSLAHLARSCSCPPLLPWTSISNIFPFWIVGGLLRNAPPFAPSFLAGTLWRVLKAIHGRSFWPHLDLLAFFFFCKVEGFGGCRIGCFIIFYWLTRHVAVAIQKRRAWLRFLIVSLLKSRGLRRMPHFWRHLFRRKRFVT